MANRFWSRLALVCVCGVSGCAPATYWDKPGAAPGEWDQVKANCLLEGMQKVPVAPVYTLVPGSSYSSTHCDKRGRGCSTYYTDTPPSMRQDDGNAELRDQVVRGCLARNGWVERLRE